MDSKFEHYKSILKKMSKAGVSDGTLARIAGVSIMVIRSLLYKNGYKPSGRIMERMETNIPQFLEIFNK